MSWSQVLSAFETGSSLVLKSKIASRVMHNSCSNSMVFTSHQEDLLCFMGMIEAHAGVHVARQNMTKLDTKLDKTRQNMTKLNTKLDKT
jgi:hypothetical protein